MNDDISAGASAEQREMQEREAAASFDISTIEARARAAKKRSEGMSPEGVLALCASYRRMEEALRWYAEPVLAYAITQEKEPRSAVHEDGGKRAREALGADR